MKNSKGLTGDQMLKWLNKLTPAERKKPVIFISEEFSVSLPVTKIKKQPFALLWDGEDDPSGLHSRSYYLNEMEMEPDEVDTMVEEVAKGDIVIE